MDNGNPPMDAVKYEAWLQDTLKPEEAADFLKIELTELARLRTQGGGPMFRRYGHRSIRYIRRDLIAWRDDHSFQSTAEYKKPAQDGEDAPGSTGSGAGAS